MDNISKTLIFSMTLTLCVCVLGLIGNVLSVITLLQKDMRSSTSYLLLGLSASDILLLTLSFIRTLNNIYPLHLDYSAALLTFIFFWDWICTSGTKYFTIAVSLERYAAICHPFRAVDWLTEKKAKMYTFSVFLFCVLLAAWSYIYANYLAAYGFDVYVAIVLHFLPFVVVLVLNVLIYLGLRSFQKSRKKLSTADASLVSVTRMLLCVVIVFGVCYSFEFVRRILNYAGYFDTKKYKYYDYTLNHLADIFYVLNSSVNFIIYILLGTKFRNQFLKLMKTAFGYLKKPCGALNDETQLAKGETTISTST